MNGFGKRNRYEMDGIIDKSPCSGVDKLAGFNVFSIVFAGTVYPFGNAQLWTQATCITVL